MASKKTIIGCNKFNDKSAISNSNFTTNLKQSLTLNEGDTIAVKTSFIDTRNKIAGYYSIPKDVIISMEYYFYYINRGGNQITSNQIANETGKSTTQQCIACDNPAPGKNPRSNLPYPAFIENPTQNSFINPVSDDIAYSQYITNNHSAYKQTIPITNDTTATGKIPANLSPLLESVYHCYSNVNVDNTKTQYFSPDGKFNQSAFSNNPSGFNTTLDIESGDGLPYLLHYYVPENVDKNNKVSPINFTDMVIGQTYSIIDTGLQWNGGFNTNWINIASTLTAPQNGLNFVCESNVNVEYTFINIANFDTVNSFSIINSIGIDYGLYGGQSLPANTNTIVKMYNSVVVGKWYKFIENITPKFLDGSVLSFYNDICGIPPNTQPIIGDMFVSIDNSPTGEIIINNNLINNISPGMTLEVITLGLINWELLGYITNQPTDNDIDISQAELNVNYKVITTGDNWGSNNQFKQSSNNSYVGDIINLTSAYTPFTIVMPTFNPTQLQPIFNGEYYVIINSGTGTNEWQQYFDVMPGNTTDAFDIGNIIIAKNISADMSGLDQTVVLQWIQINSIPVGTTITVSNISTIAVDLLELMGFNFGSDTFTTTRKLTDDDLSGFDYLPDPNTGLPSLTATISFTKPNMLLRNNEIQTPFTFTVISNPAYFTDTTYEAYLIPTDAIQEIVNYTYPLPPFKPTSQIQGGYNHSFTASVVSTGRVGDQNLSTNVYDNKALNTGKMKPFTKSFKFKIKAGSYSPEYLAEILTRAMSVQKPKQNTKNGKIKISTPIVNITEQMIDKATLQEEATNALYSGGGANDLSLKQWNSDGYSGITGFDGGFIQDVNGITQDEVHQIQNVPCPSNHPYLHQGGFPYTATGQIDTYANLPSLWQNYIGNNQFVPKNQNILPTGQNLDDTKLPINPKYSENDFNFNGLLTGDDTPFLYRPNAYGTRSDYDSRHMNIKLTYNDANLEYMNDLQPFGKQADNSIRNIEMAYKPLCHDASSDYFESKQSLFNLNETTDYSIRPIVSVPFTQIGVLLQYQSSANNFTSCLPSGIRNIASPLVGSTQMAITYGDEDNNLFSFPYLHTGIYSKADPTTNATTESIGIYKNSTNIITTDVNGENPVVKKISSVFQAESQSGLLLKNLKATYIDGTESTFWEDLGFDVNAITAQNNKTTLDDDTFTIAYNDFLSKTTRGFSGTANVYDNQSKCDLNEISPISYFDSYTMSGYHLTPTSSNNFGDKGNGLLGLYSWFSSNYSLYNQPLYFAVEKTKSIDASRNFTNLSDTGHVLLSVEGFNGSLINSETKMNIKSIISSYYSSSNFITNPNSEDIIYEHVGEPLDINNLKIVLIDPFTGVEVENIGPNSSIYFTVNQQLQFQNTNQKKK